MKKNFNNSILGKVLLGTFLVLFIPFILVNIYAYRLNYKESLSKTVDSNRYLLGVGLDTTEEYFSQLNKIPLLIYEDISLQALLKKKKAFTSAEQYNLRQIISNMINQDSSIRLASIQCNNGAVITQEKIGSDNKKQWRTATYAQTKLPIKSGYNTDGIPTVLNYSIDLADEPLDTKLVKVNFYCVQDKLNSIAEKIGEDRVNKTMIIISLDQLEKPLYLTEKINEMKYFSYEDGYITGQLNGENGFFFIGTCNYLDMELRVTKFVPKGVITAPINRLIFQLLAVQSIVLLFGVLFVCFIYRSMIRPIKNIASNIDKVQEGEYEYHAFYKAKDEIGVLDYKYEEMVTKINVLVNQDFKNALEISKTRLKMLQAQINPHFLNNMLQTISTQALKNGDRDVSNSISKLARIFQYNMNTAVDYVPLQEELHHINNYSQLNQARFREDLDYSIHCEKELESIIVPKMILQPLVENSIKHGIRQSETKGKIEINIYREKILVIEIKDNGVGFTKEKIESLKEEFKSYKITPYAGHGIGFLNVLQRLDIYAKEFSWDIISIPNVETKIILYLDIQEEAL